MSLLLAPYNDSMRLGMGFNSYTQTIAIDRAVEVTDEKRVRAESPSQIVTYSSRFVERLSEIVNSLNISYSSSIKKGTVEVAGSNNTVNEEKIKSSDLNAVVSVKVVNQTTILTDNCVFKPLPGVDPGTAAFNEAFGDCYISGFIEGGDFNGIISIRVLDRSKTDKATKQIKSSLKVGNKDGFTLDSDAFSASDSNSSEALKDTETTYSVSWMGGGQVKDENEQWTMDSVFAAAAAFPAKVAKCPQRTWAILTKYKANRSFQTYAGSKLFTALEYDLVTSFTAELFENFMEYKSLIQFVQDIITNRGKYKAQIQKSNAISTEVATLVAVKAAFRREMTKIVQVVDLLARDPTLLRRSGVQTRPSKDPTILSIVESAISTAAPASTGAGTTASTSTDASSAAPASTAAVTPSDQPKLDIGSLIAPEIWTDLLPVPLSELTGTGGQEARSLDDFLAMIPPAPTTDPKAVTAATGGADASKRLYDTTVAFSADESSKIDTLQASRPGLAKDFMLSQAYGSETQGTYFNHLDLLQPYFVLEYIAVEMSGGAVGAIVVRYTNGLTLVRGKLTGQKLIESSPLAPSERFVGGSLQLGQSTSVANQSRLLSLTLITNRGQVFQAQSADSRFVGFGTFKRDGVDFKKVETITFNSPLPGGRLVGLWGRSEDLSSASGAVGVWRLGMIWSDMSSVPATPALNATSSTSTALIVPEGGWVNTVSTAVNPTESVTVTFTPAKPSVPRIIYGIDAVWINVNTLGFRTKFTIADVTTSSFKVIGTWDNALLSGWNPWCQWLCLPDNLPSVQIGRVGSNTITNNSALFTINLPRAYANLPEAHCWFEGFALEQSPTRYRGRCAVKSIERDSFVIKVESWGNNILTSANIGWIAWDPVVEGLRIRGGNISGGPTTVSRAASVPWPGGAYAQSPAGFGALSEFDIAAGTTITHLVAGIYRSSARDGVDKDNLKFNLATDNTTFERLGFTWISINK